MKTHFKKTTLAALPLAGVLVTAPVTFAHDEWQEHQAVHEDLNAEHQAIHRDLNAEHRAAHTYPMTRRQHRRLHRQLRREHRAAHEALNAEHQAIHRDLNAEHRDYHDFNW